MSKEAGNKLLQAGRLNEYRKLTARQGFGTKFHDVYKKNPEIYKIFSEAEDKENVILKKIIKLHKKSGSILDVACGTGKLAGLLSKKGRRVWAIDTSLPLLEIARKENKQVHFVRAAAEKLPFPDNMFEICLSTWGSFSPAETVAEMKRVTKSGGYIIRVGTAGIDELTSLFPNYDQNLVDNIKKYYDSMGFKTKFLNIKITFRSLSEAQNILSTITGCEPPRIKSRTIKHRIMFQTNLVKK